MLGRGGARAHVVYPLVDLSSLEHPQWLDEAGREVDVDPSTVAGPSNPQDGLAKTDADEEAIVVEENDPVQQIEDVEMEIDAEAEEAGFGDEEAVGEELLSVADSSVLHYSLLQSRQRHIAQLLPHIFSHPPIPSHARPRARAPPKSQFTFPTPPPPTQPLPYPEYHGPKPPDKPKDKTGSKEASPSTPSTPKPGDDEGSSSQTKDPAASSGTHDDNKDSPLKADPSSTEVTDTPAPKGGRARKNKAAAAAEEDAPAHETECIARVTLSVGPISYPETELWVGRFVEPRVSGPRHSRPRGERGSEARVSGSAGRPKGTGGSGRRSLALDATLRRAKMTLDSGPNGPLRPGYMPSPTPGMPGRPYRPLGPGMPPRPPGPGNYPQRPFPAPPVGFGPLPNAPPAGARQNIPPALIQRVNAAAARHPWLSVIIHKAARSSASKDELAKLGRIVARLNRGEDVGEGPEEGLPPAAGLSAAPAGTSVRPPATGPNQSLGAAAPQPTASTPQVSQNSAAPVAQRSSATAANVDVKPSVQPAADPTRTSASKPAAAQTPVVDSESELSDDEDFMHGPPQVGGGPGPEPESTEASGLAVPVPGSPDSSLSSAPPSPEVAPAPPPITKPAYESAPSDSPAANIAPGPAAGSTSVRPAPTPALPHAAGPARPGGPNTSAYRPHAPMSTPRPVARPPSGSPFTTPFPQTPSLGPRPPCVPYGRPPGRPPYNAANPPPHPILGPGRPYSYGGPLPQTPSGSPHTYPRPGMSPAGPRPYSPNTPPLLPPRAAAPAPPPPPPIPLWPAVPRFLLVAFKEQQTEKYLIPLGMNTYMSRVGGDYVTGPPPPPPVITQRPNSMGPTPTATPSVAGPSSISTPAGGTPGQAVAAAQSTSGTGGIGTTAVALVSGMASGSISNDEGPAPPAVPAAVEPQPNIPTTAVGGRGRTRAALGRQAKGNGPASPTVSKAQPPVPVKKEAEEPLPPKQEALVDQPKIKPERPVSTLPALSGEKPRPGTVLISMMVPITGWSKPDWKEVELGLPWSNEALMKPRPPKPTPANEDSKGVEAPVQLSAAPDFPKPATPRKKRATVAAKEAHVQPTEVSERPTPKEKRLPHVYNLSAQDFTPKGDTPMQAVTIRLEGVDDALWRKIKAVSDENRFEEIRVMLEEETELVAELRTLAPPSVKGPNGNFVALNAGAPVPPKVQAAAEEANKAPIAGQSVPATGSQTSTAGIANVLSAAGSTPSTAATPAAVPASPAASADPGTPLSSAGPATAPPPTAATPPTTTSAEAPRPIVVPPNGSTPGTMQPLPGPPTGNLAPQTPVRNAPPIRPPFRPFPNPAELRLLNGIYDDRKRDRFSRLLKRVQPRSFLRYRVAQVDSVIKDALSDKWAPRPYPITTKPLHNPAEEDSALDQPDMPDFDFLEPSKGKKRKKDEQEEVFAYEMPVSLDALDELVEEGAARLTGGRRGRGRGGGMRGGRSARANDGPSVEVDENGNVRKRYGKRSKPGAVCEGCAGQGLRVWRKGPGGKGTLCNACGDKFLAGTLGELKAPGVNGPAEDTKDAQDGNSDGEKDAEEEKENGKEHSVGRADSVDVKKEAIAAETAPSPSDQESTSNVTGPIIATELQPNERSGETANTVALPDEQPGSNPIKEVLQPEEPSVASETADSISEEQAVPAETVKQPETEQMDVD